MDGSLEEWKFIPCEVWEDGSMAVLQDGKGSSWMERWKDGSLFVMEEWNGPSRLPPSPLIITKA